MAYLGKKFYLLLVLFLGLVVRKINFTTPEFDPLRQQWEELTSNRYYTEYIIPFHKSVATHVTPQISRANSILADRYQVSVASHVQSLTDSVSKSSSYGKVIGLKAKIDPYLAKIDPYLVIISAHFKEYSQLAASKTAVGIVKAEALGKLAIAKSQTYFTVVSHNVKSSYATLKPIVAEFYNGTVVPFSKHALERAAELLTKTYNHIILFYSTKVDPLIQTKIVSVVKPRYDQHLKKYVDLARFHSTKYYNIFRVESALSLSKNLIAGSYEQASNFFKKETVVKADTPDPTYATIEDDSTELTDTETLNVEETPVVEALDDDEVEIEAVGTENVIPENSAGALETNAADDGVVISLAQEIDTWKEFIYSKVESLNKNFDKDVDQLEEEFLSELQPKVTKLLQNFTQTLVDDYAIINKDIYSIDSNPFLLESGEAVEIDSHDNILDKKITREDFRAKINAKKEFPAQHSDTIHEFAIGHIKELEHLVDQERSTIVDIYEEFAEVAINEFSKKMMYSTFANSFNHLNEISDDSENYQDWKEYIKVKNYIIAQREVLISKRQELNATKKYISEIQMTLKTIVHEAGSYYAILRAKANLEFQNREQREREASLRLDNEETPTTTSTVLKYLTLQSGETLETKETTVEIETPQDEEISDLESNDGDYDAGFEQQVESAVVGQQDDDQVILREDTQSTVEETVDETVEEAASTVEPVEQVTKEIIPDEVEEPAADEVEDVQEPVEESTPEAEEETETSEAQNLADETTETRNEAEKVQETGEEKEVSETEGEEEEEADEEQEEEEEEEEEAEEEEEEEEVEAEEDIVQHEEDQSVEESAISEDSEESETTDIVEHEPDQEENASVEN